MSGLSYLFNGRFRADPFPRLRDSEADTAPKGSLEAQAAIARVRAAMGVTDRKHVRTKPTPPVRTWADPLRTEP